MKMTFSDLRSTGLPILGKPLQQLLFLIRDYHLQSKSGREYLTEYFSGNYRGSLDEVRQTWTDVDAFLLPTIALHPEYLKLVPNRKSPYFAGPMPNSQMEISALHITPLIRSLISQHRFLRSVVGVSTDSTRK